MIGQLLKKHAILLKKALKEGFSNRITMKIWMRFHKKINKSNQDEMT